MTELFRDPTPAQEGVKSLKYSKIQNYIMRWGMWGTVVEQGLAGARP